MKPKGVCLHVISCTIGWNVIKYTSLYKSDRINSLLDFGDLDKVFMTEIGTIDWFARWGTPVFSENTAIFICIIISFLFYGYPK